jgi:hypothetical protein
MSEPNTDLGGGLNQDAEGFARWLRDAVEEQGRSDGSGARIRDHDQAGAGSNEGGFLVEMHGLVFWVRVSREHGPPKGS